MLYQESKISGREKSVAFVMVCYGMCSESVDCYIVNYELASC